MRRLSLQAISLVGAVRRTGPLHRISHRILQVSTRTSHDHAQESTNPCWACGKRNQCCHMFCGCGHIVPLVHHCNYFQLLGIPLSFTIDEKKLEKNYQQLQKKLHPDMYTTATQVEKEASALNSSLINMAYELLSSPTQRAAYLLNLHGVNILEEGRTFQNPALLSEVMELREEIEDAKTPQEAEAVASRLQPLIQSTSRQVQQHLEAKDYQAMADAAVRLKYYIKVQEEAKNKAHLFQIHDKKHMAMN